MIFRVEVNVISNQGKFPCGGKVAVLASGGNHGDGLIFGVGNSSVLRGHSLIPYSNN